MIGQLLSTSKAGFVEVTALLGSGAQGEVYETDHPEYLLKVCRPTWVDEIDEIRRIRRNSVKRYRTFSRLNFGADLEVAALPLEYVKVEYDGPTPAFLMRRAQGHLMEGNIRNSISKLRLLDRYRIALSLTKAVSYLHSRDVVHADIRPRNFCYQASGLVQMLDIDGGGYYGGLPGTSTFMPMVEPLEKYKAPELVRKSWRAIWLRHDFRKEPDLWSLAVLLYQILVDPEGPFPIKPQINDPTYEYFRPGDYASDHPEWPRPWQMDEMKDKQIDPHLASLFENVFRTTKRMDYLNSKRPDAIDWQAAINHAIQETVPPLVLIGTATPVTVAVLTPAPPRVAQIAAVNLAPSNTVTTSSPPPQATAASSPIPGTGTSSVPTSVPLNPPVRPPTVTAAAGLAPGAWLLLSAIGVICVLFIILNRLTASTSNVSPPSLGPLPSADTISPIPGIVTRPTPPTAYAPPVSATIAGAEVPNATWQVTYPTSTPWTLGRMTYVPGEKLYVCVGAANVQSGPGAEYPIVGTVTSDWYVTAYGKIGGWYYLGYNEQYVRLFMYQSVLCARSPQTERLTTSSGGRFGSPGGETATIPPAAAVTPIPPHELRVCAEWAAVRQWPAPDAPVVEQIAKDGRWVVSGHRGRVVFWHKHRQKRP